MDNKITLRPIVKDDLEWARLLRNNNKQYFFDPTRISKNKQERWFQTLNYSFFIVEYNKKAAGTVGVKRLYNGFELTNVLIDKHYRKKGILRQVVHLLEKKYGSPLYVDVLPQNKIAIAAYKKIGFSPFSFRLKKI